MIHQVKASPENVGNLRQVVQLQLSLLRYAVQNQNFETNLVENHLRPIYGNNSQSVTDWVHRKSKLISTLEEFASHHNSNEKNNFVHALESDIQLLYNPQPGRLQVAFSQNIPDWQKSVGDFFHWYYERWGSKTGFQSYIFVPELQDANTYTRWDFIDGFSKHNKNLYLCAICDATAYRATIDSRAYTSIEHFFPKSIYPHLILHPYNLIPICTFCNSGSARSLNPLDYCSQQMGITELLLPYQNEEGLSIQAYIEIRPRCVTQGQQNQLHPLEIHIQPASGRNAQTFIELFERIYRIGERWNEDLDQIDQHVFRRITQFLTGDVHLGNDLRDVDALIGRLELLMALTSKESLGQDPFGFAMVWLLKHHIDMLSQDRQAAPIYIALHDWAENQQEHFASLRSHVQELYQRVPAGGDDE